MLPLTGVKMKSIVVTGEEQGYVGSKAHAAQLAERNEHHKVKLMVNLDMIGWNNPKGFLRFHLMRPRPFACIFTALAFRPHCGARDAERMRAYRRPLRQGCRHGLLHSRGQVPQALGI
jgi:hypothetical protein